MSRYSHHVPGRLRVRTQSFRCQPGKIEAAVGRLRESTGIDAVAVNTRAGNITVHYDPAQRTHAELLAMLEEIGCVGARRVAGQFPIPPAPSPASQIRKPPILARRFDPGEPAAYGVKQQYAQHPGSVG